MQQLRNTAKTASTSASSASSAHQEYTVCVPRVQSGDWELEAAWRAYLHRQTGLDFDRYRAMWNARGFCLVTDDKAVVNAVLVAMPGARQISNWHAESEMNGE